MAVILSDTFSFAPESPLGADLARLFDRHRVEMHAETPPESIHMMPRGDLASPHVGFFVFRDSGQPVGMAALKRLDDDHAEVKSMHILAEVRGRGLSFLMLDRLIGLARLSGITRLSLETGAQPGFVAARRLYARAGFHECPPFGDYRPDPNSVFMSLTL